MWGCRGVGVWWGLVEQRAEALRLYREGLSLREVGRRMGVDRKLVRAALVAEGEEIRARPVGGPPFLAHGGG